jgi:serine/threonine protein phosphatase PrpC
MEVIMAFFRSPHSDQQEQVSSPDRQNTESPETAEQQSTSPQHPEEASVPVQETPDTEQDDTTETPEQQGQTPHTAQRSEAVTQPLHPLLSEHDDALDEASEQSIPEQEGSPENPAPARPGQTKELVPPDTPDTPAHQESAGFAEHDDTQMLDPEQMPMLTTHRSVQTLTAAARRDIGRVRQTNQDSVLSLLTYLPREGTDMPLGLFVVADGMGGHEGGEIASRLAIRTIMQEVFAQLVMPTLDDAMIEAIQPMLISAVQEANQVIWEHAQMMGSDMGTTCTVALLLGRAFYLAHVGDSRAYLYEPGGLRTLTDDHSTVGRLIELGQLTPEQAQDHPLRNQLYRTVGQQPQVQVDFIYQPIENSTHLLVCSDGLWGMVSEDHIKDALTRSPWPQDACDELIALANLAGGEDNISVVVVTLPVTERLHS